MEFQGGIETICGNVIYGDDDENPMRERDELWKHDSFVDGDEIPMWQRDLWKCNLFATMTKFQGGIETNCGNAI